jgi:rubredoxin
MTNMKCVSCGIGFFSATGSDKCSRCAGKDSHTMAEDHHDSCGCGHSH